MKKAALMVVGLLVASLSYSQDFYRVVRESIMEYRDEKWVTTATQNPSDLFIIIKDWDVSIGKYKFKTYDAPEKVNYGTHITYTYKCINGEGAKCFFMMKKFDPQVSTHTTMSIIYESGIMYDYEVE